MGRSPLMFRSHQWRRFPVIISLKNLFTLVFWDANIFSDTPQRASTIPSDGIWDICQHAFSICNLKEYYDFKILECVVSQHEVYSDSIIPRVKSQHLKTITHNLAEEVQHSVHKTTALSFPLREWQVWRAIVRRDKKTGMSPSITTTLTFRVADVPSLKCQNYAQGHSPSIVSNFLNALAALFHLLSTKPFQLRKWVACRFTETRRRGILPLLFSLTMGNGKFQASPNFDWLRPKTHAGKNGSWESWEIDLAYPISPN